MSDPLTRNDLEQLLDTYSADPVWLAERLHVHPSTVRKWIKEQGLTVIHPGGLNVRHVLVADVLRLLGIDPDSGEQVGPEPTQLMLRLVGRDDRRRAAGE